MADDPIDPLDRLDRLLADQEKAFRDAFRAFVESVSSSLVIDQIMEKLAARDIAGAMQIVDTYVARMADVIPRISMAVGQHTAGELSDMLHSAIPELAAGIGFDPTHPRAAQLVRDHRLAFVRDFSNKQRQAVQQALNRALNEGLHPIEAARSFRGAIGLTGYQEQIVANYRAQLGSLDRKALDRELRDRRSDSVLERAIDRRRPLTARQIDSMVERYRRNFLAMRADTIARTESLQAFSEARDESAEQAFELAGLDRARIEDIWNATRDKRTRDWHRSMDGQKRQHGEPFKDGLGNLLRYPGDPRAPAETRINCRCIKTFSVRAAP